MRFSFIAILLMGLAMNIWAQNKNIKVQVMHEGKVVVDTTLNMTSDEAKIVIESMVQQFSKEPVHIDTKLTHGLYVFNITNENWKEQSDTNVASKNKEGNVNSKDDINWDEEKDYSKTNEIELDSLWREFSGELNETWDEMEIEVVIDSLGVSFKELWNEMEIDINNNPDVQEFKSDLKNFFKDFSKTQFIIIQEEDTVKLK